MNFGTGTGYPVSATNYYIGLIHGTSWFTLWGLVESNRFALFLAQSAVRRFSSFHVWFLFQFTAELWVFRQFSDDYYLYFTPGWRKSKKWNGTFVVERYIPRTNIYWKSDKNGTFCSWTVHSTDNG